MVLWGDKPSLETTEPNADEDRGIDILMQIQDCGCPPDELIRDIGGDPTLFNLNSPDASSTDFQAQGCPVM